MLFIISSYIDVPKVVSVEHVFITDFLARYINL